MRSAVIAGFVALALVVGACSSGDDSTSTATSTTVVAAGRTSAPPSTGPIMSTTTVAGTPVSDAEISAQAGLDSSQAACVTASGVDGEFETTPGPTLLDAMVLTTDDGRMIAIPADLKTGTELQQALLDALAANCAPHELLAKLAAIDGAAIDDSALTDDLPARLFLRKTEGATAAEATCLDEKFRQAPARLSSLAANPALVESQCASAERRATWRRNALDAGLATAGAADDARACLVATPTDQALLAAAVDAVGQGQAPIDAIGTGTPTCVSATRLGQLALDIVAKGADFGAETLAPG